MEGFVDGQTTARDEVFEQLPALDVFYDEISNVGRQSHRIRSKQWESTYKSFDVSYTSYKLRTLG
jgi:hypothetical protein